MPALQHRSSIRPARFSSQPQRPAARDRRLLLESLEDRRLLSTVRFDDPQANVADVIDFAISSDERYAVYLTDDQLANSDHSSLYSVSIDTGQVTRLDNTLLSPSEFQISPDGTRVVFTATQESEVFELYSVPITGGDNQKLNGSLVEGGSVSSFGEQAFFEITSDGTRVVYLADQDVDDVFELYSVSLFGGPVVKLNAPQTRDISNVIVTPDSSRVVYRARQDSSERELYSVTIGGGEPVRLGGTNARSIEITPDGERAVFLVGDLLFSVAVAGGDLVELSRGVDNDFQITGDGEQVVYRANRQSQTADLYAVPTDGGPSVKLSVGLQDANDKIAFVVTPDFNHVVYLIREAVGPRSSFYRVPLAGGDSVLLQEASDVTNFRVSSDSMQLVYSTGKPLSTELRSIPLAGGEPAILRSSTPQSIVSDFQVSQDSAHVVYAAWDFNAEMSQLWSVPVTGGAAALVGSPQDEVNGFEVHRDRVFYLGVSTDKVSQLYSAPVLGGESEILNNPIESLGGQVFDLQVSANGQYGAYLADHAREGEWQLYSVEFATGDIRTLDTVFTDSLQISPDSRIVVYSVGRQELRSVPITGGVPTTLNEPFASAANELREFVVSPDSRYVLYRADQDSRDVYELYSVPSNGGPTIKLNRPLSPEVDVEGDFLISPDSHRVVYREKQDGSGNDALFSVSLQGENRTQLSPPRGTGASVETGAKISEDGQWVVYLSDQETAGVFEIFSVPINGGMPEKINGPLAPGGTIRSAGDNFFQISADSSRVVYRAEQDTDGVRELYSASISGGDIVKLNRPLPFDGNVLDALISPDGRHVVYRADQDRTDLVEIYSVPILGGDVIKLNAALMGSRDIAGPFQISPDSSHVVYRSNNDNFSTFELYGVPIAGGTSVKLNGALVPGGEPRIDLKFSPDGQRVFYLADQDVVDQFHLYEVPVTGGQARRVNEPAPIGRSRFGSDSFFLNFETNLVVYLAGPGSFRPGDVGLYGTPLDLDENAQLVVTSIRPTATGFELQLSNPLEPEALNLYDAQQAAFGVADVTLTGDRVGPVSGSLVLDDARRQLTFVKSGGPLQPDDYLLTVRSGVGGVRRPDGRLLDGNRDQIAGDSFEYAFEIEPYLYAVGLPDFVRGPGQEVNLPADGSSGIPLTVRNHEEIRSIEFRIAYDPNALQLHDIGVPATMPVGATATLDTQIRGVATVSFSTPSPLPPGEHIFSNLRATVPEGDASEVYGGQRVLDVQAIAVRDSDGIAAPAIDDDAVHFVAFFGDVSGDRRINAGDAALAARVAARLDAGFATARLTDPLTVADVSGNGHLNAFDASLVARFAAALPVSQIPPVPSSAATLDDGRPLPISVLLPVHALSSSKKAMANRNAEDVAVVDEASSPASERVVAISRSAVDTVMAGLGSRTITDNDEQERPVTLQETIVELLSESLASSNLNCGR